MEIIVNFDDFITEPVLDQGLFESLGPIPNSEEDQQGFLARKKIEEILERKRQSQYMDDF